MRRTVFDPEMRTTHAGIRFNVGRPGGRTIAFGLTTISDREMHECGTLDGSRMNS